MDAAPRSTTLDAAWPLFALRIRSERLVLRLPTDDELLGAHATLAQAGIHPPDEMPFGVAWSTIAEPGVRARLPRAPLGRPGGAGQPDDWEPPPAGRARRRRRSGRRALHARAVRGPADGRHRVLARTAVPGPGLRQGDARRGARRSPSTASAPSVAQTEAFLDNAASNGGLALARLRGERDRRSSRPRACRARSQRFRMTAEMWRSRPRPPVTIEGLDACRDMFGAERRDRAAASAPPPPRSRRRRRPRRRRSRRPRSRRRRLPDDDGEFPIVPSADIIPPMSGMPESEKRPPPLPAAPPRWRRRRRPTIGTRSGTRSADAFGAGRLDLLEAAARGRPRSRSGGPGPCPTRRPGRASRASASPASSTTCCIERACAIVFSSVRR